MKLKYTPLLMIFLFSAPAHAYIGPGMGAGVIASILGVIASVFLSLFAIIYYPIKRLLKKRKNRALPTEAVDEMDQEKK